MGNILRHENKLIHRIIERKIESKRGQVRLRTSLVKQMISEDRETSYTELKKLAENIKERRAQIQLQNQP